MKMDYKKKYFSSLKNIKYIETQMKMDRCPAIRNCCGGCLLLKAKLKKIKKENGTN